MRARAIPTLTEPVELAQRRACSFVWFRLNRKRSSLIVSRQLSSGEGLIYRFHQIRVRQTGLKLDLHCVTRKENGLLFDGPRTAATGSGRHGSEQGLASLATHELRPDHARVGNLLARRLQPRADRGSCHLGFAQLADESEPTVLYELVEPTLGAAQVTLCGACLDVRLERLNRREQYHSSRLGEPRYRQIAFLGKVLELCILV